MERKANAWAVCKKDSGVDLDKSWQWLTKSDMKGCTETLICGSQEQAQKTTNVPF